MEKISTSISQGSDNPTSSHQSKWFQTTLPEMNKKVEAMLKLTEESSDSLADRVETYCKRRPELRQLVEEFSTSYRSLSEICDQLRSESIQAPSPEKEQRRNNSTKTEALKFHDRFIHSNPENDWSKMKCQVTELMEENMQLQEELIKRNKRNRDLIRELRFRLHRSMAERSVRQSNIGRSTDTMKHKQFKTSSRLKGLLGKLCGRFSRISQSTD